MPRKDVFRPPLKNNFKIPLKTVPVSEARARLPRLLDDLAAAPRVYQITRSGKPAAALVNLEWLRRVVTQARGRKPFSIFGDDKVAGDWKEALREIRRNAETHVIERWERVNRENP